MKNYRWQLIIILITALIVGILLLVRDRTANEQIEATPNPISGGIYTEALIGQFIRLNPFLDIYNQPDRDVDQLIFNGLVRFDENGYPEPDLAETWSISREGTIYTFSLRDNILWHDGFRITTNDIEYTINLLKSGNALIPNDLQKFWSEISIKVLSEKLIQFSLPEAYTPFIDYMSFKILPEHLLGDLSLDEIIDHPYNLAPIGSGPFKFDTLIYNENEIVGVVLVANADYYDSKPYFDEVVFLYYPDEQAAWQAYKNNEVDGISTVTDTILPFVLDEPGLNLYSMQKPSMDIIFLNLGNDKVTFFQEAQFRRALMKSINRQYIIDKVFLGQAIIANGPIMPANWAYFQEIENIEYFPEAARNMFALMGLTLDEEGETLITEAGQEVSFELLVPDNYHHVEVANIIKDQWETVGLSIDLNVKSYDEIIAALEKRDYEAALVNINFAGSPDPDPYPFWGQAEAQGGQNYSQWNNRTASEFIEQARVITNYGTRTRLYRNFQVIFQEELPSLPLFYPIHNYAIKNKIYGVSIGQLFDLSDRLNSINRWYILAEVPEPQITDTVP